MQRAQKAFLDNFNLVKQFGAIAKLELFGSGPSDHWGVVDFHKPVAEFARESLDAIMEVKVASAEKSEERRRDRWAYQ